MNHGCHNRPDFLPKLQVQDGWTPDGRRVMKTIPFTMARECMYDLKGEDTGCNGCRHRDEAAI